MKKIFFVLLLLFTGGWMIISHDAAVELEDVTEVVEAQEVVPAVDVRLETYTVAEGDTFTSAMEAIDISYSDALAIVEAAEDTFDFTRINVGKSFQLRYEDDMPVRLSYEPDAETIVVVDLLNDFETTEEQIQYEIQYEQVNVRITNSMFADGLKADLAETTLLQFVDIFAWEIDFATQVQGGDTFTVLYEKRFRDGKESGVGQVVYGSFTNVGETAHAYRYIDSEGEVAYYNQDGDSLVRQFLKAPLNYSRISSGFTYARFHPVLNSTMPHRAIDYAAPSGTPVKAVADGTVTYAGWNGGFGNYVDIRHNSVYETQYAHLSRIYVTGGEHVRQGDVIGLVGSTGFSTGPHLHYQVEVNGTLTNPLEVEFPKGDAIPEEEKERFFEQRSQIDVILR